MRQKPVFPIHRLMLSTVLITAMITPETLGVAAADFSDGADIFLTDSALEEPALSAAGTSGDFFDDFTSENSIGGGYYSPG